jgi:HD-like signal output (HDOD) protein
MLLLQQRGSTKESHPTQVSPEQIRAALDRIQELPTMYDTAVRAMGLANDPDSPVSEYINLIRRDGAVTAKILKVANSVIFRGRHPIDTINQAVVRLGIRECTNLVAAIGISGIYKYANKQSQEACEQLLKHAYLTATLAAGLNGRMRLGFKGEEFCAGLLHDLGRLLLVVSAPDAFHAVDPLTFEEDAFILDHEQAILGINHCQIGANYATKNRLPDSILNCIKYHHKPEIAIPEHANLVALISLADHLANHIHRERKVTNYIPADSPGYSVLTAGWEFGRIHTLTTAISATVVTAMRECRIMIKAQSL